MMDRMRGQPVKAASMPSPPGPNVLGEAIRAKQPSGAPQGCRNGNRTRPKNTPRFTLKSTVFGAVSSQTGVPRTVFWIFS